MRGLGVKILGLGLIFGILLGFVCVGGLLRGVYIDGWRAYWPFLVDGNMLWMGVLCGLLCMYPAVIIGRVHLRRLWFHHYIYGAALFFGAILGLAVFGRVMPWELLTLNSPDLGISAGRFFVVGGLALVVDDLADVSVQIRHGLVWLKGVAFRARRVLDVLQLVFACGCLYVAFAVGTWLTVFGGLWMPANVILVSDFLVVGLMGFVVWAKRFWVKFKF